MRWSIVLGCFLCTWTMGLRKQCRSRHGVHAMPSHSSADQLWNIKESMSKFFETAYKSPELTDFNLGLGIGNAIQKLTGMNSDHAEDQKKLFWLIRLEVQRMDGSPWCTAL